MEGSSNFRKNTDWEWEIRPATSWFGINLGELLSYKDLLFRLVRREFLMLYQQTLLGPVWILIQPILTVITYVLIFHQIIGISTEGIPAFLFYFTGITLWNLFSDIFLGTSVTFINNLQVFNKVYFPRIIVPLSVMILHLLRFAIQLIMLLGVVIFYVIRGDVGLHINTWLLAIPAIALASLMGLGLGLLFSVLTARYRDLVNVLHLFVRLLMFLCPIFYSLSIVPEKWKSLVVATPLTPVFELFRYALVGAGTFTWQHLLYCIAATTVILVGSYMLFNKKGDLLLDVA
jgi:lipopolysaccharide transport system permease protein